MKKLLLLFSLLFVVNSAVAQPYKTIKVYKPYKWMIGVSWTVIEDDGNQLGDLFNVGSSWNYQYYPTKISLDRYLKYGWSLEAAAAYTPYLPGKRINDTTGLSGIFACFDVNGKYSFYNHYAPRMRWFDPYFTFGVGYTYRSNAAVAQHVPTLNLGFGFNIWIHRMFGIQIHTNGKLGLWPGFWDSSFHTNYFQHSAGLVFRWGEGRSKNGDFGRRKHKWAHGNKRYKKNTGH